MVIEAAPSVGSETSARNSEVVHGGMYYSPGSLKAKLCVEGRRDLYHFCDEFGVSYKKLGKLIVATSSNELKTLDAILARGLENGVHDLRFVSKNEVFEMEPNIGCEGALLSESTGIVDSHGLMQALLGDAEKHGASVALNTTVLNGTITESGIQLNVCDTPSPLPSDLSGQSSQSEFSEDRSPSLLTESVDMEPEVTLRLLAKQVVNSAGLEAVPLANRITGMPAGVIPKRHLAKGCYFSLSGVTSPSRSPVFNRLIYPVPEEGGLGVHVTIDLGNQIKFGPDVEWLPEPQKFKKHFSRYDYTVDPKRAAKFYPGIRKFFPGLPEGCLQPSYSGIRPKISGRAEPAADFLIQGSGALNGVRGWVNLLGVESPGLTACLAIARHVAKIL